MKNGEKRLVFFAGRGYVCPNKKTTVFVSKEGYARLLRHAAKEGGGVIAARRAVKQLNVKIRVPRSAFVVSQAPCNVGWVRLLARPQQTAFDEEMALNEQSIPLVDATDDGVDTWVRGPFPSDPERDLFD